MDTNKQITAAVFSAFLKCPLKAYLLSVGDTAPGTFFADIKSRISSMYSAAATCRLRPGVRTTAYLDFEELWGNLDYRDITYHVNCETAVYHVALPTDIPARLHRQNPSLSTRFVPVLYIPWDKPDLSDSMALSFGALALSHATGILADTGILIYGSDFRHKTVNIGGHITGTRQVIDTILTSRRGQEPPPLVLNRHCAVCDFQPRCRGLAIEQDDLSLLTAMTVKDRTKCKAKGVLSIVQLSYGYRPRRRKRTRPDAESSAKSAKRAPPEARNDHKLKALAIKKNQIHVVGSPSLKIDGIPTFLDVEGMPDRDFYYLIGLRFECRGEQVEKSFWADRLNDERDMWESCLETLKEIGNAQIVTYGAYEIRFLKQMKDRYVITPDDAAFVDRLIETLVNLVGCIYGKIYFPTYSNSLKEVGRYLGFEWTWPLASGAAAPLLRRNWELEANEELKRALIGYNMEDCRAAATVADALLRICDSGTSAINIASLEVGFQRTFGKFDSALPEFAQINSAAYWNYQRSKVYARTEKAIQRAVKTSQSRSRNVKIDKEVMVGDSPETCDRCHGTRIWTDRQQSNLVYDLKFTQSGIKRSVVRYRYKVCRCGECQKTMNTFTRNSLYGPDLRAFVVYLVIELRLSNKNIAEHVSSLFNLALTKETVNRIKSDAAERYTPTYDDILRQIAKGSLVHADETKGVVKGGGHYIWVFANLTTVAYVYAESREFGDPRGFARRFQRRARLGFLCGI